MKWNFNPVVNIKLFQQHSPKSMVEESSLQSQPGGGKEQRKRCSSRDGNQGRAPLKNHRDWERWKVAEELEGNGKSYTVTGYLREGINHGSHWGFIPGANIIKVQHSLDSPGLHPPHDRLGVAAEQRCGFTCSERGKKPTIFKLYTWARHKLQLFQMLAERLLDECIPPTSTLNSGDELQFAGWSSHTVQN